MRISSMWRWATYNLKVVFDSGRGSFGKLEAPLVINAYDGERFRGERDCVQ